MDPCAKTAPWELRTLPRKPESSIAAEHISPLLSVIHLTRIGGHNHGLRRRAGR